MTVIIPILLNDALGFPILPRRKGMPITERSAGKQMSERFERCAAIDATEKSAATGYGQADAPFACTTAPKADNDVATR